MGLSFSGSNSPHDPKMSSKTHDYNHEGSALPPQPGFLRDGCAPFPMAIRGLRHIRMAGTMRIRSRFARRGAAFAAAAVFAGCLCAQADEPGLPHLVRKDGRHALIVDGAPFLILGAQSNNSSAWPATLPRVWSAIERAQANTLEVPVYWEQLEPERGKFDYSVVDQLLSGAREHRGRLRAPLVWHLEERQLALPADVAEAPARALPAHHR